ncbi:hypothetical protein V5O48_014053 [Marasmius crinis-equi]|uniref:Uncharacterized protein n=1 Tax=Marasmius crinis-equi TaxID=585013 RepID=A0ABR3EYS4_9AGAR
MDTGHMSTSFNNTLEPQPTHSPTISVSNLVKSNLGTSLIALAVIPVLALGTYLVRRYRRRLKRRTKKGVNAMLEDCTPYNYSKPSKSSKFSNEKDIQAPALPETAYRFPHSPVVKEVERYKTPPSTATPAISSPPSHVSPNPVNDTSNSLHGVPLEGRYLYSYRVPHFVPGVSSRRCEFNARSPCSPGSLSPSPLPPVGAPLMIYPMNANGQLLCNIPWIHERTTSPGINSLPPVLHSSPPKRPRVLLEESIPRSPSSTHSKLTSAELQIKSCSSKNLDGNVEDRYPAASSSFLSLYLKNSRPDLASIQDDLDVQESEDGNIYDFPTASSVGTSEPGIDPALVVNEYYAPSSDEAVTSRAVQEIMDDDRKNYIGLSRKILETKANQTSMKTNIPAAPTPASALRVSKMEKETERKPEHVSTMKILDEFPTCPPPSEPLPQTPRSRKIAPIYNKRQTPYAFSYGQNSMVGMGRGSGIVTKPREKASWDMSIKENVPF